MVRIATKNLIEDAWMFERIAERYERIAREYRDRAEWARKEVATRNDGQGVSEK